MLVTLRGYDRWRTEPPDDIVDPSECDHESTHWEPVLRITYDGEGRAEVLQEGECRVCGAGVSVAYERGDVEHG
jgi:hypothetical protein